MHTMSDMQDRAVNEDISVELGQRTWLRSGMVAFPANSLAAILRDDLWMTVLSYLSWRADLGSAALTCRKFYIRTFGL